MCFHLLDLILEKMSQPLPREQGEEEEEKEKTTKGIQQQSWYSDFRDGGSKVFVHTSGNKQFCCEGKRPESTTKEKPLELESWQKAGKIITRASCNCQHRISKWDYIRRSLASWKTGWLLQPFHLFFIILLDLGNFRSHYKISGYAVEWAINCVLALSQDSMRQVSLMHAEVSTGRPSLEVTSELTLWYQKSSSLLLEIEGHRIPSSSPFLPGRGS